MAKRTQIVISGGKAKSVDIKKAVLAAAKEPPKKKEQAPKKDKVIHAKLSPSAGKSFDICEGWLPEDREDKDTTAADEGTMMHDAAENRNFTLLDEKQTAMVTMCLDYVDNRRKTYGKGMKVYKERRMNVANITFGTADELLVEGKRADLFDYKFGYNEVEDAETNLQGWAYGIGLFHDFPDVDEVTVHFLQPRRDEISTFTFTRKEHLPAMQARWLLIKSRVDKPDSKKKYTFDVDNCLYCGRKTTCPVLNKLAKSFGKQYDKEGRLPEFGHRPSETLDGAEFAEKFAVARVLEGWVDSVKGHAVQFALAGNDVPGYSLRERSGRRDIKTEDTPLAYKELVLTKKQGTSAPVLSHDEFIKCASVSVSKVEEVVGDKAEKGSKTEAKIKFSEHIAALGIVTIGSPTYYLQKDK